MKKYVTIDVVIGVVLILFSVWFWGLSLAFPEAARMFPQLFLALTFILSVLMVINSVKERAGEIKQAQAREKESFLKQFALPCKAYCIMILYIIGIRFIGFFTATSLFMLAFMYFLKVRSRITLFTVIAGMDLFLYLMFSVGLKLSLPSGFLF